MRIGKLVAQGVNMDYNKHYNSLMVSRLLLNRHKSNDIILELHHIIPRSLGGNNNKNNLILLTPREHFLAHWLLYKIHTGTDKAKMAYAFFKMCSNNPNQHRMISSRKYAIAKHAMSIACTGVHHPMHGKKLWSDDDKKKISDRQRGVNNSMYGKSPWNKGLAGVIKLSDEHKEKIKLANIGRIVSLDTRQKLSSRHSGKTLSDSTKQKLRECNLGKTRSAASIQQTADKLRGKPHNIITCPYCNKSGGSVAMYRWHFDNCKKRII